MTNFNLSICDVKEIVRKRFKVTPVRVEPWFSDVIINANAVSSQTVNYTWRYSGDAFESAPSSSKEFPFYIGDVEMNLYNDGIGVSIANSYVLVSDLNLTSIGTFYNITGEQLKRFGVGTYGGLNFPAPYTNVNENNNPSHFVTSPFMQISVFTDGTGAVFMSIHLTFKGYIVYLS